MRSIYLVFGCCLMFAAVMLMGLSMQSCKSKRTVERNVQMDSMAMSVYKEELDSFAFSRLLERYQKNWSLEIRHYRPVKDSTGKVTHTYLEKDIRMRHRHEKERDSSGCNVVFISKEDSTEVQVSEDTEHKEEPVARDYKIFFFLLLMVLLFVRMKK